MLMDKQLRIKAFAEFVYKLAFKKKLYRFDLTRKLSSGRVKKLRDKVQWILPLDDRVFCIPKEKVVINQQIDHDGDVVLPSDVIDHFIDQSTYRSIMKTCFCRESNHCKDHSVDLGCLFLGEAAKKIHPDLHTPVSKEEAKAHLKKCRENGLVHLTGRLNADAIYLNVSPHDKLFTVCSCCACCCISMVTPYVHHGFTDFFQKLPGVDVSVSEDCIGCEKCLDACIFGGIKIEGSSAVITEGCRGCGRCAEVCPNSAITVTMSPDAVSQAIDILSSRVDVT